MRMIFWVSPLIAPYIWTLHGTRVSQRVPWSSRGVGSKSLCAHARMKTAQALRSACLRAASPALSQDRQCRASSHSTSVPRSARQTMRRRARRKLSVRATSSWNPSCLVCLPLAPHTGRSLSAFTSGRTTRATFCRLMRGAKWRSTRSRTSFLPFARGASRGEGVCGATRGNKNNSRLTTTLPATASASNSRIVSPSS